MFFFTVGKKYNPIGFVCVPGPVQALEWSPHSHVSRHRDPLRPTYLNLYVQEHHQLSGFSYHFTQSENRLLILCQSGHVIEVHCPDPEAHKPTKTFQLPELPSRTFRFKSIKSRIKVWAPSVLALACRLYSLCLAILLSSLIFLLPSGLFAVGFQLQIKSTCLF